MTVKQDLQAARDLITDPKHWTQNTPARDMTGKPCNSDAPEAVCFCIYGAVGHVTQCDITRYGSCVASIMEVEDSPGFFNDTHNHQEVLDLLDRTITSLPEGST